MLSLTGLSRAGVSRAGLCVAGLPRPRRSAAGSVSMAGRGASPPGPRPATSPQPNRPDPPHTRTARPSRLRDGRLRGGKASLGRDGVGGVTAGGAEASRVCDSCCCKRSRWLRSCRLPSTTVAVCCRNLSSKMRGSSSTNRSSCINSCWAALNSSCNWRMDAANTTSSMAPASQLAGCPMNSRLGNDPG